MTFGVSSTSTCTVLTPSFWMLIQSGHLTHICCMIAYLLAFLTFLCALVVSQKHGPSLCERPSWLPPRLRQQHHRQYEHDHRLSTRPPLVGSPQRWRRRPRDEHRCWWWQQWWRRQRIEHLVQLAAWEESASVPAVWVVAAARASAPAATGLVTLSSSSACPRALHPHRT